MEHAQQPGVEVGATAVGVEQAAASATASGIAIALIVKSRRARSSSRLRRADLGQRPGLRVGLRRVRARSTSSSAEPRLRGREALVLDHLAAEPRGQLGRRRPRRRRRGRRGRGPAAGRAPPRRPGRAARPPGGSRRSARARGSPLAQGGDEVGLAQPRFGMGLFPYHDPFPGWPTPPNPRAADPQSAAPRSGRAGGTTAASSAAAIGGGVVLVAAGVVDRLPRSSSGPSDVSNGAERALQAGEAQEGQSRRRTGRCSATTARARAGCRRTGSGRRSSELWKYGDRPLIEFPPIFVDGRLYFVNNNGHAFALDADTGKVHLAAATSPS